VPIVGRPGSGQAQSGIGKTAVGTLNLKGGTPITPNVTLTPLQMSWLNRQGGPTIGPGGTLKGPGTQVGAPGTSPPAGGGPTGPGGTPPGTSPPGSSSSGGTTIPPLVFPTFPTIKAPSWWTPPPKPANLSWLAGIIRNGFFAGLGSLDGYPYSTQQVYQAYLYPMLQSQNQTEPDVLPATLTITIYDSSGNQVSQDIVTMTQFSATVGVPGTYLLAGAYTVEVIASVAGAQSLTSHYGPFTGAQLASASAPVGFIVPYNPAGTAAGMFTFVNGDGSPAVGVPVQIVVSSPASDTQTPSSLGAPANSLTNSQGQVAWAAQLEFLSPNGVYQVAALVYTGTLNADGTISGDLLGSWTSPDLTYEAIQTYTPPTIFLDALSPPPSQTLGGQGTGTGTNTGKSGGPPHHGKT
jgi:hypothetical protein